MTEQLVGGEHYYETLDELDAPIINTAFLTAGLLDEISLLIGSGIDGRGGMQAVFDGREKEERVIPMHLASVTQRGEAVWVRYYKK